MNAHTDINAALAARGHLPVDRSPTVEKRTLSSFFTMKPVPESGEYTCPHCHTKGLSVDDMDPRTAESMCAVGWKVRIWGALICKDCADLVMQPIPASPRCNGGGSVAVPDYVRGKTYHDVCGATSC